MSPHRQIDIASRGGRLLSRQVLACATIATAGLLLAVAPAAGDLPAAGETAPSRSAPNCSMRGSKTMQANSSVRVFRATNSGVYGCRRSADRAFRLGDWGECQNNDEISRVEVGGRYAGFVSTTCSLYSSWQVVALVSLRSGRFDFESPPMLPWPTSESMFDAVTRIVVDDRGGMAWIARRSGGGRTIAIEVRRRARGSGSASVVLDAGTTIDPNSLRRRGHRIFWRNGAMTSSATLG